MPLVTVTTRAGKTTLWKRAVLDGVHRALVSSGVPEADRFQRVIELGEEDFVFDARYPDTASARTGDFVLIEVLWSVGRSVKIKRKLLSDLTRISLLSLVASDHGRWSNNERSNARELSNHSVRE